MKVKELCKKVKFNEVFNALQDMYNVSYLDRLNYLRVFRKIRNAKPMNCVYTTVHIFRDKDYANIYDVYGMSQVSINKLILHFSHFNEWGNFFIEDKKWSDNKLIAHILYEATYISFNQEEIDMECINELKRGWSKCGN